VKARVLERLGGPLSGLRDAVGLRTVLVTEPGYRLAKGRPRVSGIPGVAP
jgi:hypothetical protein